MNAARVDSCPCWSVGGSRTFTQGQEHMGEGSIQTPAACSHVEEHGTALEKKAPSTTGLWFWSGFFPGAEMQITAQILCLESPQLNPKFAPEGSRGPCPCVHMCVGPENGLSDFASRQVKSHG